jgi:hypothetical protein
MFKLGRKSEACFDAATRCIYIGLATKASTDSVMTSPNTVANSYICNKWGQIKIIDAHKRCLRKSNTYLGEACIQLQTIAGST